MTAVSSAAVETVDRRHHVGRALPRVRDERRCPEVVELIRRRVHDRGDRLGCRADPVQPGDRGPVGLDEPEVLAGNRRVTPVTA